MSKDKNEVKLRGRVGSVDHRANNVVSMSIATNSYYKDKQSGEQKSKAEWHRVICFNQLGAKVKEYGIDKGARLMVEGSLRLNAWKGKDGVERNSTEIIASDIELLVVKQKLEEQKAVAQVQPRVQVQPMPQAQEQYVDGGYNGY